MPVEIVFYSQVRDAVGQESIEVDAGENEDVDGLIDRLIDRYPDLQGVLVDDEGEIASSVNVMKNGKHINHFDEDELVLADGDEVRFLPQLSGG
jgi:MoaD family protein